jgi:integrase/recombinase XerD
MNIRFVFDRRHAATKVKGVPVELMIYIKENSMKIINTGIKLYKGQWEGIVVNRSDSSDLNRRLYDFKEKIEHEISKMQEDGIELNLKNINICLSQKEERPDSFLDFMYDEIQKRNIRRNTRRQHLTSYEALVRFKKINTFSSLTVKNIEDFDLFLRKENPNRMQTTIHGYHKSIKPYVLKAFKYGYIEDNPYIKFEDIRGKSKERNPLSQEEIDMVVKCKLKGHLNKARNLFTFQIYTGLSFIDLMNFDYKKEVTFKNGVPFINGKRCKTGAEFYTPILPPAMDVLKGYEYNLPKISNERYNAYLHVIEARLGLNKPLTSHVARHTFATTVALAHDVPIESVSKMLGHKDIKTTQIYAKVLKSTIERNVIQKML